MHTEKYLPAIVLVITVVLFVTMIAAASKDFPRENIGGQAIGVMPPICYLETFCTEWNWNSVESHFCAEPVFKPVSICITYAFNPVMECVQWEEDFIMDCEDWDTEAIWSRECVQWETKETCS